MNTENSFAVQRFRNLIGSQLPKRKSEEALGQFIRSYSEPHRHYHTLQHIDECMGTCWNRRLINEAEDPVAVELALLFHDIIYDPKGKTNETQSVEIMRCILADTGALARDSYDRASACIMATVHDGLPYTQEAKIVVDCDLWILSADEPRFDQYERQVRREYGWVPIHTFLLARMSVLEAFAARPHIYSTSIGRSLFEERARENIARSLERLSRGDIPS